MEDLITNASVLFDDRAPTVTSPPLPPAPAGQPTPNYAYGSAHTRVANVPAPLQTPVRQQPQPQSPDDFTPRLPARPANSIHPSSRTNPTSPTKTSADVPPALPARPGQTSPSKQTGPEKPAPSVHKPSVPVLPENAPSPPSASASTLVATQEEDERAPVPEDNTSVQESTPPSSVRAPKSPRMPKSIPPLPAPAAGESTQLVGGDPSPPSPTVPGGFPS